MTLVVSIGPMPKLRAALIKMRGTRSRPEITFIIMTTIPNKTPIAIKDHRVIPNTTISTG